MLELASSLSHPNFEQRECNKYRGHAQGLPVFSFCLQESREQAGSGETKSQSAKVMEALDQESDSYVSGAIVGACEGHGYTTMQYRPLTGSR